MAFDNDYATLAARLRPERLKPGGLYRVAATYSISDEELMTHMKEAQNQGYDIGLPKDDLPRK